MRAAGSTARSVLGGDAGFWRRVALADGSVQLQAPDEEEGEEERPERPKVSPQTIALESAWR
eukprot:COSAG01_NODE_23338_length_819_cov_0.618056_2_plen_61_part_01